MKRIFTFTIALMSMFATLQFAKAANVVFNVTVPSPTYQCWIVGNFNGWNNNDKQLTMIDPTHFTITLDDATFATGVTVDNLEYKYLSGGGDWAYVEKYAGGAEMLANRAYKLGVTNTHKNAAGVVDDTSAPGNNGTDVVAQWASVFNPNVAPVPMNVTIDVLVPAGTFQCYIVGTFNNWAGPTAPADSCKMVLVATNPDGSMVFEKTIFSPDVNKLAYHFCCGPDWSFEQTPTVDYKYPEVNPVVAGWKAIFDPSKVGNIVVTATVPTGTTDVWVNGSFLGWNFPNGNNGTGGLKCTKNADGTFSFTAPFVLNIEYKMYNGQSWNNVEVDALGVEVANRKAAYPADAATSITVIGWKTPAAVKELNADLYKVYTNNLRVVIEGVTSNVALFDLSGRLVQSGKLVGTFTSKSLNKGMYIVKVDGATRKVSVN